MFTGAGAHAALLYRPLFDCEQSSLVEYAFDQRGRVPSIAAGLAAGLGMALQFMGSLGGGCAARLTPPWFLTGLCLHARSSPAWPGSCRVLYLHGRSSPGMTPCKPCLSPQETLLPADGCTMSANVCVSMRLECRLACTLIAAFIKTICAACGTRMVPDPAHARFVWLACAYITASCMCHLVQRAACRRMHFDQRWWTVQCWGLCRYAVAELVKLYPLLSMIWGVTLFHEFRAVGRGAIALLSAMCVVYVLGVGLLAGARNHPQQQ